MIIYILKKKKISDNIGNSTYEKSEQFFFGCRKQKTDDGQSKN